MAFSGATGNEWRAQLEALLPEPRLERTAKVSAKVLPVPMAVYGGDEDEGEEDDFPHLHRHLPYVADYPTQRATSKALRSPTMPYSDPPTPRPARRSTTYASSSAGSASGLAPESPTSGSVAGSFLHSASTGAVTSVRRSSTTSAVASAAAMPSRMPSSKSMLLRTPSTKVMPSCASALDLVDTPSLTPGLPPPSGFLNRPRPSLSSPPPLPSPPRRLIYRALTGIKRGVSAMSRALRPAPPPNRFLHLNVRCHEDRLLLWSLSSYDVDLEVLQGLERNLRSAPPTRRMPAAVYDESRCALPECAGPAEFYRIPNNKYIACRDWPSLLDVKLIPFRPHPPTREQLPGGGAVVAFDPDSHCRKTVALHFGGFNGAVGMRTAYAALKEALVWVKDKRKAGLPKDPALWRYEVGMQRPLAFCVCPAAHWRLLERCNGPCLAVLGYTWEVVVVYDGTERFVPGGRV